MSFMLLGILNSQAAGGGISYWKADFTGVENQFRGIALDSDKNPIAIGYNSSGGGIPYAMTYVSMSPDGSILNQATIDNVSSGNDVGDYVAVDGSNNIYLQGDGSSDGFINSLTSSGTLRWSRKIDSPTSFSGGNGIAFGTDASNNGALYYMGHAELSNGDQRNLLVKLDSSGNTVLIKTFKDANGSFREPNLGQILPPKYGTPYSNKVLVTFRSNAYGMGIAEFDTSLNSTTVKVFGGTSFDQTSAMVRDSVGNIYLGGDTFAGDYSLIKLNSSLNIQWNKALSTGGEITSLAVDSEDNIHAITDRAEFQKWDASGNLLYQRYYPGVSGTSGIVVDPDDVLYIGTKAGNSGCVLKLPVDGSLTYPTSFSVSSLSTTSSTRSVNVSSGGSTISSITPTLYANTLTESLTTLG